MRVLELRQEVHSGKKYDRRHGPESPWIYLQVGAGDQTGREKTPEDPRQ